MKNKTLENRILYWQAKKPGIKLFDTTSPLYAIIHEVDNTKGASWLEVNVLNDFVDGLMYGLIGSLKGENSEEAKKSNQLVKPVLDFLRDFRDRIIDSEISTNEKFIVNGAEILITRDEIIKQARRSNDKMLRTRGDVTETLKDFIAYKRDLYSLKPENTTSQTQQIQEASNELKQTLISTKKAEKELPIRLITFNNDDVLELIYNELKAYFPKYEKELKSALDGEKLEKPLPFSYNQNRLVEVFRRLKYNGFLLSSSTQIKYWLCKNFERTVNGNKVKFNENTVWDILSKGNGEATKKERICVVDWLPYKGKAALDREKQNEQL